MYRNLIFYPVLAQVALTLVIYVRLLRTRIRAVRAGQVDKARMGLHDDAWPENVLQVKNNLTNQFQLPVLFYVLCLMLWALEAVGAVVLVAAWLFVASRIVHAWVHVTSNRIRYRFRSFAVGWFVVIAMALIALWRLIGRALT